MPRKIYIIENLDCANCAAKIEAKFNSHPQVQEAIITFATRQLRLTADDPDSLMPELTDIARTVEHNVAIYPRENAHKHKDSREHFEPSAHHDGCGCGHHDHDHECACGHHHDHDHKCACGHHHEHDHECACGHHHDHDHECACGHHHDHDHECACGHHHDHAEHKHKDSHEHSDPHTHNHGSDGLADILAGTALFAGTLVLHHLGLNLPMLLCAIGAYILLGRKVNMTALSNLVKGHVFDENFLMSIATIGAFFIGEYPEAVGVMLFYRVGEYFEHRAVERSRSQIMEAVDLRPEMVNMLIGDAVWEVPAEDVRIGDILLVRPGDRIPLDGTVLEGESPIDTSPITGEPIPVHVFPGSEVISGCVNTTGRLVIRVDKELSESMVTRILDSVENAAASKPKIDRFITRFARVYTPVVVAIAAATAIIPSIFTGDWNHWVYTALSFLVMSCPCALVLSVPLAFFSGIGSGSRKGILFKGGTSMEAMAKVKAVVMDKTGTLTRGEFKVHKVAGGHDVLRLCASCEQQSSHPIAVSIVAAAKEKGMELFSPDSLEEIPGQGIRAMVDGQTILCGSDRLLQEAGVKFDPIPDESGTCVLVAVDDRFVGWLVIGDTLKADAAPAISRLKRQGYVTAMLTGDGDGAARAIALETAIDEVHSKLLPHQKLERLRKIRSTIGPAMFVGDGINDAPVLAGADVGAAMGSGADAAIEAADVVFMTSSVEAIPEALSIARKTNAIAWQNVVFALAVKAVVMILGLLGHASMWLAVFADSGVAMLCVLNSIRILYKK